MTHTPGPWQQFTDTYEDGPQVSVGRALGNHRTPQYVATICGWGQDFETDTEQQANARLIAAAPDLLNALKDIAQFSKTLSAEALGRIAQAAIAKATVQP